MSERSRQRYLHIRNRLEELAWKLGPLEEEPLPDWLDNMDGWNARMAAQDAAQDAPPDPPAQPDPAPEPPQKRAPRRSTRKPGADW